MNTSKQPSITNESFENFLKKTGLDMEVQKIPSPNVLTGEPNSGFYDIYNGKTKQKIHSGVGEGYKVIQFRQAFDAVRQISGLKDVKLVTGGTWKGGAEGWAQMDLGTFTVGKKDSSGRGDNISQRLTMLTSHNSTFMFDLIHTPFRYWCKNQLPGIATLAGIRRARESESLLKTRHTGKGLILIENLPEVLEFVNGQFERTVEIYNKLADIKIIDRDFIKEVLARLLPVKDSERSKNSVKKQVSQIMENYKDADGDRIERDTAYNLYNSIQGAYQHNPIRRTQTHDRSVLVGTIAEKSAVALQVVLDVCSSQKVNVLDANDPIAKLLKDIEEGPGLGD